MLQRCYNPHHASYPYYGGRGITVCLEWQQSFMAFYTDMGPRPTPRHSIERKNNDLGYEPTNCRWATRKEQVRNRRRNRFITFQGQTLCLTDWAEVTGINASTLSHRFHAGWDIEAMLTIRPKYNKTSSI
jgi:hypothetical protein